jgi:hypothetical protein
MLERPNGLAPRQYIIGCPHPLQTIQLIAQTAFLQSPPTAMDATPPVVRQGGGPAGSMAKLGLCFETDVLDDKYEKFIFS